MPTVYRVEDREGQGYYQGYLSRLCENAGLDLTDSRTRHPSPFSDAEYDKLGRTMLRMGPEAHFGFSSLEQLQDWFHTEEWRRGISRRRGRVVALEVPPHAYHEGNYQVIFDAREAYAKRVLKSSEWVPQLHYEQLAEAA